MERIVKKLIEENKTISTMESCTGGGLANAITNIPDASKVIHGAVVTYSNPEKIKEGVSEELIEKYSVYSPEVAREMAYQVSISRDSNYGVGITGKLGKPDDNNPFGDDNVVYFSIYDRDNDIYYDKTMWVSHDNRIDNKQEIIDEVTNMLYEILYEKEKSATR